MKKVFIAVALVATLGLALVSCNKDEKKCWQLTLKEGNATLEYYWWGSENDLDIFKKELEDDGTKVSSSKANTKYNTLEACSSQNVSGILY